MGWSGFDLDGTIATYKGWQGVRHIGEPIKPMVDLIKKLLAEGKDVRIMTARVNPKNVDVEEARTTIKEWCKLHIGVELPMTCEKDYGMIELYDDRAIQVVLNTGEIVGNKNKYETTQEDDIYK